MLILPIISWKCYIYIYCQLLFQILNIVQGGHQHLTWFILSSPDQHLRGLHNPQKFGKCLDTDGYDLSPEQKESFLGPEEIQDLNHFFFAITNRSKGLKCSFDAFYGTKSSPKNVDDKNLVLSAYGCCDLPRWTDSVGRPAKLLAIMARVFGV